MTQAEMLSINTVAAKLGLSVHQLRRWELMFGLEIKRGRGQQRQYRPEDLSILERIKELVEQGWPTSQIRPQLEAEGLITPKLIGVPQQPGNPEMLMEAIIGLRSFAERRFIEISKQIDELRQLMISITLRNELRNEIQSPWQPVEEEFAPPPMDLPAEEISIGPAVNVQLPETEYGSGSVYPPPPPPPPPAPAPVTQAPTTPAPSTSAPASTDRAVSSSSLGSAASQSAAQAPSSITPSASPISPAISPAQPASPPATPVSAPAALFPGMSAGVSPSAPGSLMNSSSERPSLSMPSISKGGDSSSSSLSSSSSSSASGTPSSMPEPLDDFGDDMEIGDEDEEPEMASPPSPLAAPISMAPPMTSPVLPAAPSAPVAAPPPMTPSVSSQLSSSLPSTPAATPVTPAAALPAAVPAPSTPAAPAKKPANPLGEVTDQNYLTVLGKALDMIGWTDEQADQYSQDNFGISHWDELGRSEAEKLISFLLEQMGK